MAVNKNFVVKNGLEVSNNLIIADAARNKVGIGSTTPRTELDVRGGIAATDINISGVGTIVTLQSTIGTVTNLGGTNLSYSGIGTIGTVLVSSANVSGITTTTSLNVSGIATVAVGIVTNLRGTNLNYSGIATAGSVNIGATQVISSGRQLQNIASLDATTTATIESAIANAPNTFSDLSVTGFSTLGAVSAGNISLAGIATGLNAPGISTLGSVQSTTLNVSGVTTLGVTTATNITAQNLNVSGIGTITNIISTNINNTGIGTIATFNATTGTITNLNGTSVNYTGISTLTDVRSTTFINTGVATLGTVKVSSGIITAISGIVTYYGDGQYLTGLAGNPTLQVVLNTGNTSTIGMSITGVVTATTFSGALTGNATGLSGTPNITVGNITSGNINSSGVVTATSFSGNLTGNVTGNATGLSGNPSITVTNATVNGTLSVGGTSVILNAATLQINDRDITLGITTNALGNNVANDTTANHGGIAIASTVGTPIIDIPTDAVNTDLPTYKQIMWVKQNHYSGLGTDAWIFNYGVSIGNTATVRNGSRLTVGTGFTVYDSGNVTAGVITATSFFGNGSNLTGTGSTVFNDTTTNQSYYPVFTSITSGTITSLGISTSKLTYNPSTGAVTAVDFNSTSDINLKTNIKTVENALEIVDNLRGVSFEWKESGKNSYGVIAQELEKVLPELVKDGDIKSVNYNGVIGILIEAVKELSEEVRSLKNTK